MPRPRGCRRLRFRSKTNCFKPKGVPTCHLEEVLLTKEELEAIKLKDHDGLDQIKSAEKMNTSQSTFQRILSSARGKIAQAVIEGKMLKIEE